MDHLKIFSQRIDLVETAFAESDILGLADESNGRISIKKGLPRDIRHQTILHESLHMILEMTGFRVEEQMVATLANGLMMLMKDNPKFIAEIIQK